MRKIEAEKEKISFINVILILMIFLGKVWNKQLDKQNSRKQITLQFMYMLIAVIQFTKS